MRVEEDVVRFDVLVLDVVVGALQCECVVFFVDG